MEHYFIGKHDLGTFPDILLVIEHENEDYEIPFGPRTYFGIDRQTFLHLADGSHEIRRVKQGVSAEWCPIY
jgi:hypothetical protein